MSTFISAGIEPVSRLKVADSVAAQLVHLVSSGAYRPGDKLPPERQLAQQFGVGRSSMREALRSVEADGLLRIEHGIGVFVRERGQRNGHDARLLIAGDYSVTELFELRLPLERDAAGLAARRVSAEQVGVLREILAEAADTATSDERFIQLDAQLHRTIAEGSGNRLFSDVMELVQPLFLTYSRRVIALPERRQHAHEGHVQLVEAIAGGRVRDARSAAVRHLRDVEHDIATHLLND